ncbi:hypothetical protein ESCO_003186 [Escovopsis weberi]|uniref:Uncharacterized protein n=1 Tax=Escovopsis weberi TaxID=150374 RepID=A0A0M8N115_ESCWE|nr:hypothetical protein ESCO_003186 [Escovopsis weberi]
MSKAKKQVVADSWDDEDVSDDAPEEPALKPSDLTPAASTSAASHPAAAPSHPDMHDWDTTEPTSARHSQGDASAEKRPEKTDAVARRMIAAGLGLKAPKQTEEQKAYQKAIKEQEKKRKELDRVEEQRRREMTEKAKAAVWDD